MTSQPWSCAHALRFVHCIFCNALQQLSERFSDHFDPHALEVFNHSTVLFTRAVEAGVNGFSCQSVGIPYEGVQLPAYFCPVAGNASTAPTVVAVYVQFVPPNVLLRTCLKILYATSLHMCSMSPSLTLHPATALTAPC